MTNRVLDLSDRPARLSVRNSLLVVRWVDEDNGGGMPPNDAEQPSYPCERLNDPSEMTIPLADIAVLIVSHPQVSFTQQVLSGLAAAGGILVTCDEKHMPASMMLPLVTHSLQAERFAAQAAAPLPLTVAFSVSQQRFPANHSASAGGANTRLQCISAAVPGKP